MIFNTKISREILGALLVTFGLFFIPSTVSAKLVFVTEENSVNENNFIINADDSSSDYVDLEFGSALGVKLRYDILNNNFVLNRDLEVLGNIQNSGNIKSDGAGDNYFMGKIGVGKAVPAYDIDVESPDPARIRLRGGSSGYTNAALILEATNDANTRGLGMFMHDAGADNEWYAGRPYSDNDRFVINRKTSVASHQEGTAEDSPANTLFSLLGNGNLGLGTMNPANKLHIKSDTGGSPLQKNEVEDSEAVYTSYKNSDNEWYVGQDSTESFAVYDVTGGSNRVFGIAAGATANSFYIKNNGNIGIGTTNPATKLEVNGQVKITGGTPGDNKVLTSDSSGLAIWKDIDIAVPNLTLESSRMTYENYNSSFLMAGDLGKFQYTDYINANPTKREIIRQYSAPGASGSIKITGSGGTYVADDFIAVNPAKKYRGVATVMQPTSNTAGTRYYFGIKAYDADKNFIQHQMVNYYGNTVTTLSQDFNPGDTVLHLTDASNWINSGGYGHQKVWRVWRQQADGKYAYVGAGGKQYDELGYTREGQYNAWNDGDVDFTANTITLKNAWTGANIPAGTKIANFYGGGTYTYYISSKPEPNDGEWHTYKSLWREGEGKPQDHDGNDNANSPAFRNGTSYVKVMALFNYRKDDNTTYDSSDVGYYSVLGLEAASPDNFAGKDGNIFYGGNVGIGTTVPTSKLQVTGLADYADNTAASSAGLTVGAFYRTGDILKVVH